MSGRTCTHCGKSCPYEKPQAYHVSSGLCNTCQDYQREHGRLRPWHLIDLARERESALLNLCDCGEAATHELDVMVGLANGGRQTKITLLLCDDCHALEMEPVGFEPAPEWTLRGLRFPLDYPIRVR
jgi:hypothetical protein